MAAELEKHAIKPRWLVNVFGGPGESSFEISVAREDNRHGRESYGWFDERKLLVSHNGGPCRWPVTPQVWKRLLDAAKDVAADLNAIDV